MHLRFRWQEPRWFRCRLGSRLDARRCQRLGPDRRRQANVPGSLALQTINGAYQLRLEHRTGSLVTGKAADLTVLDADLFRIDPREVHAVPVAVSYTHLTLPTKA